MIGAAAQQQIVFTSADARYMPGALVSLYSALLHSSAKMFILVTSAPQSDWPANHVHTLFENQGASLIIVESSSLPLQSMAGATDRFPAEAFARFFADFLPSSEASRALYVDSDVMALGDLNPLLELDLGNACIGAAPDIHAISKGKLARQQKRIGLSTDHVYLGSGVLLIDLSRYQLSKVREEITSTLSARTGQLIYPDQDALNLADRSEIEVISPRFNFPPGLWRFLTAAEREQVAILHFYDGSKPWGGRAHRIPIDLIGRYDGYAEDLGLLDVIRSERPDPMTRHSSLYRQKFWLENIARRSAARSAISDWLPV